MRSHRFCRRILQLPFVYIVYGRRVLVQHTMDVMGHIANERHPSPRLLVGVNQQRMLQLVPELKYLSFIGSYGVQATISLTNPIFCERGSRQSQIGMGVFGL